MRQAWGRVLRSAGEACQHEIASAATVEITVTCEAGDAGTPLIVD